MRKRLQAWHDKTQWFRERDAWVLFKLAAYAEAFGWMLLAFGVFYASKEWPKYHSVIVVAGRTHGVFFTIYILSTLLLSRSLRWRWYTVAAALAASAPPLGSLVFEQIMARTRYKKVWRDIRILSVKKGKTLLWQPARGLDWELPGGLVGPSESDEQAVARFCKLVGITPPAVLHATSPGIYTVGTTASPQRASREHDDAEYRRK